MINHIIKISIIIILFTAFFYAQDSTLKTSESNSTDSVFVMKKSPWGAVLRSAIIPGWGQFYNESYLKIPIIWGLAAWFIYNWNLNNNYYKTYESLTLQDYNYYYKNRDIYHDQRDLFTIYLGITYFLNLVDAYVDAQLFDFSFSQNQTTGQPMVNLRVKF